MKRFLANLWRDESGQDLAEYALLLGLIAVALVGAVIALRQAIQNRFEETQGALSGDTGSDPD